MCTCLCVCVFYRISVPFSSLSLMQWIGVLVGLIGPQQGNKYPTFYGTQSFITLFTRAHLGSPVLSQINPVGVLLSYKVRPKSFKTTVIKHR